MHQIFKSVHRYKINGSFWNALLNREKYHSTLRWSSITSKGRKKERKRQRKKSRKKEKKKKSINEEKHKKKNYCLEWSRAWKQVPVGNHDPLTQGSPYFPWNSSTKTQWKQMLSVTLVTPTWIQPVLFLGHNMEV